jgi:hypothetical protein
MPNAESEAWQKKADDFHLYIGHCIAAWADVDDQLFRVFRDCVGPYEQCAIIYYRTPGLDVRFKLTDEIVKSILPKPERKDGGHDHEDVQIWKDTIKDADSLLATRRRIAHHPVSLRMRPGSEKIGTLNTQMFNAIATPPESWFEIYMSEHERQRGRSVHLPPLQVEDLADHLFGVTVLCDNLRAFFHNVLIRQLAERTPPSSPPQATTTAET